MKISPSVLDFLHLDSVNSLLTARDMKLVISLFNSLDVNEKSALNGKSVRGSSLRENNNLLFLKKDLEFYAFMRYLTDLTKREIYIVFDKLDIDNSGSIEFEEFYFVLCILIAIKDNQVKEFIYRHSKTVFDLLDDNNSNSVSAEEFNKIGFLFNFDKSSVNAIFNEFDISGDQELDYKEFRMFTMACIDRQRELSMKKEQSIQMRKEFERLRGKQKKIEHLQKHGLLKYE